jgi:sugar phosphate isomerase/epimerase
MRLGTTSYIYPADIAANVRRLAGQVNDIELVIFEVDDFGNNYPDGKTVSELNRIASDHDLTFTVHLPLDIRLADGDPLIHKAVHVVEATRELNPVGYIVHFDARDQTGPGDVDRWLKNSLQSLEHLIPAVGDPARVCAENLDSHPPAMLQALLEHAPISCCIDVGHLWKRGENAPAWLEALLSRAAVVHLHGVGKRDHMRLSLMSPEELDPVVELLGNKYHGVLTFEIFNEMDFLDCLKTFRESSERVAGKQYEGD